MYAVKQGDYKMTRTLIEDGRANAKIAENVSIIATVEPPNAVRPCEVSDMDTLFFAMGQTKASCMVS